MGVIATTYINMAISTAILRDDRAGPMSPPGWDRRSWVVAAITVVTLGLGVAAYGVHVRASTLPAVILTLVLGSAAFTTLGIGITRFVPNAEAAPVIVNVTVLPLTFISSIWFPPDGMPKALISVAKIFPIRALADGLQHAFDPRTVGAGLNGGDIAPS
jgi:ABC-2 type transport system permease protein